jgi:hypothetical protein
VKTLTARQLNRTLLARQLLLEPARLTVPRALERMAGLQAQYAPSMYIGLWTRLAGFERDQLTKLLEQRAVVQGTLLRSTIHLVSAEDYWPFAMAVHQGRREWFLRVVRDRPSAEDLAEAAGRLRTLLAEGGPLRRAELEAQFGPKAVAEMGMFLDLVRVPPSGTWARRRADLFAAALDWLGEPTCTAEQGLEVIVRRYLGGFGPATRAQVADWAGLPGAVVAPVLDRVAPRRFRTEDGTELVDLPRAPLPDPDTPAPVRFLPTWDAALLAHARRSGILPEEHRPKVFSTKMPQSIGTFLVDGAVAGTWRYADRRVATEAFTPLPAAVRREVEEEADRLAAFHA